MRGELRASTVSFLRPTLGRFLSWWTGELAAMVPPALRSRAPAISLLLELNARALTACRVVDQERSVLAEVPRVPRAGDGGDAAEPRADLSVVHRLVDPDETPVLLRLTPDEALCRRVELPRAAVENLREVLAFEMHRLTPFRAEEVYFAHRLAEAPAADPSKVAVELTVVRRTLMDEVLAMLSPWDLRVAEAAEPRPAHAGDTSVYLRLVPSAPRPPPRRYGRRLLWAANAALALVVLAVPLVQQERTLRELSARVEDARARGLASQRVRMEADRLMAARRFLIDKKRETPSAAHVLVELTVALPDSTWLQRLQLRGDEVQVHGTSQSASSLVKLIEDMPRFRRARISAPVTRNPTTGVERFQLVFELIPSGDLDDASNVPAGEQGIGPLAADAGAGGGG